MKLINQNNIMGIGAVLVFWVQWLISGNFFLSIVVILPPILVIILELSSKTQNDIKEKGK